MKNEKPYHLMTPAERTARRIAENRNIDEKVKVTRQIESRQEVKRINAGIRKTVKELAASDPAMMILLNDFALVHPDAARGLGLPLVSFRRMSF